MPESVGIYYRDDELDELLAFDRVAKQYQDRGYSRSQAVREAMDMYQMILETMETMGWSLDKRDREAAVKSALLAEHRREDS